MRTTSITRYLALPKPSIVILENLLLTVAALLGQAQTFSAVATPADHAIGFARCFFVATTFQVFLHFADAYDFRSRILGRHAFIRLVGALGAACALLAVLYLILAHLVVEPAGSLLLMLLRLSVLVIVWHSLLRVYFDVRPARSTVLIMGTGPLARALAKEILRHRELGLSICGFVDDDPNLVGVSIVNPKVIGLTKDLLHITVANRVNRVAVEIQDRRGRLPVYDLLQLKTSGVEVEDATTLYERITGKIAIENLKPSWMVFNEGFPVSRRMLLLKRIASLLVSVPLLVVVLPLFPLIALLIKLESKGPVFHRQARVGKHGRIFTLWKFRSMRQDAERDSGPVWSVRGDNRITRIGKILRRSRMDELPQLFNVLTGNMDLVGPRPERPHFVEELSRVIPFYQLRHSVKPGVTGWAQINYGYGSSVEDAAEKLQYDLFYIKNMSSFLDVVIMFNTLKTMLVRPGS